MAESEWARNMRRQAEKQTGYASDQAHYAAQSAYAQQEAAAEARYAAESAARSEQIAHEQLLEQKKMSRQNHDHNFAMWRQTTNNGQSYDRWLFQAQPLVDEFAGRWRQWVTAKDADIASFEASKIEDSIARFKVNARMVANIENEGNSLKAAFMNGVMEYMIISIGLGVCWIAATIARIFSQVVDGFVRAATPYFNALVLLTIAYVLIKIIVQIPRGMKQMKANSNATVWRKEEVAAFISALPRDWSRDGEERAWNQMVAAETTIDSMPSAYVEFTPQMLSDVDLGLPRAMYPSLVPPEAECTRALLNVWAEKSIPHADTALANAPE